MVLGLSNDASDEEIKQEYKRKALKYHPDKIKDESKRKRYETKFKVIKDAYEEIVKQRQQQSSLASSQRSRFSHPHAGMPPFTTIFQDMFQRMNDFDTMGQQFEQRIEDLHKSFTNIDVNHDEPRKKPDTGNFYSKRVFFSNINGKKIKKVEENMNGQIHQYEEYDDNGNATRTQQLKKN